MFTLCRAFVQNFDVLRMMACSKMCYVLLALSLCLCETLSPYSFEGLCFFQSVFSVTFTNVGSLVFLRVFVSSETF
jgi:hypothetical protein